MKHGVFHQAIRFVPAALLALYLFPAAAAEPEPAKIPVVKTFGELLAAPTVKEGEFAWPKAAGGKDASAPKIHVGISGLSSDLHDGIILYLLIEEPAPFHLIENFPSDFLGPFPVTVEGPQEAPQVKLAESRQLAENLAEMPEGGHRLFMKTIPMTSPGTCKIGLTGIKGETFAAAKVEVSRESAQLWTPWAEPLQKAREEAAEGGEDPISVEDVSNPKSGAAFPKAENSSGQIVAKNTDPKTSLPALWPEAPHPKARCYLETNLLTVQLDQPYEIMFPLRHFLTRWWVNGKAARLSPKVEELEALRAWCGHVPNEDQFQFAIEFAADRLGAKDGDVIGVQLLFCPGGWEYGKEEMEKLAESAVSDRTMSLSVLLPRVDFVWKDGKLQPRES